MNKFYLILLLIISFILIFKISDISADVTSSGASSTQSNVSGSNTTIQGYESTTNNTYQGQVTNSTQNSTSNTTNQKTAVSTAPAPAPSSYSQSSCVIPLGLGATVIGFSASFSNYYIDEACERRKKAELLHKFGMKISAISLLCQDPDIFDAMLTSATPCPVLHEGESLIGKDAMKVILESRKETDDQIENYKKYKKSLKNGSNFR